MTDWIINEIRECCGKYKERVAGSDSCRAASYHMAEQLKGYADTVKKEDFTLSPQAFVASIPLQALCDILGAACMWIYVFAGIRAMLTVSVICFVIAFISWVYEYVLYRPAFDFLYPKATGQNVHAVRKASGETERRVILVGHSDAPYEMPLFMKLPAKLLAALIVLADGGMVLSLIFCLIMLYLAPGTAVLKAFCIAEAVFALGYIPFLFFINWKCVTDGANDNLSACYTAMAVLKDLAETGVRYEHTDVEVLITDGEESGLRGAAAFAEEHGPELMEKETLIIAMDTLHDPKEIQIYQRGINFTVGNSKEVCNIIKQAGIECGVDIPYTQFYPGATDAEAFSRHGLSAAAFCEVSHDPKPYYHTRFDTADNLNADGIGLAYRVARKIVDLAAK